MIGSTLHAYSLARESGCEVRFSLRHGGLAGSGLLGRRFKAENWLHVARGWRFDYPQEIQSAGHLTTNDTWKSLTRLSDHLSLSPCLHGAFLLGPTSVASMLSRRVALSWCRRPPSSYLVSRQCTDCQHCGLLCHITSDALGTCTISASPDGCGCGCGCRHLCHVSHLLSSN